MPGRLPSIYLPYHLAEADPIPETSLVVNFEGPPKLAALSGARNVVAPAID